MYNTKTLVLLTALAGAPATMAQQFPDPNCDKLAQDLILAAPTIAPDLLTYITDHEDEIPDPNNLLRDAPAYVEELCDLAGDLPQSLLVDFQEWGSALLSFANVQLSAYDEVVTKCVATGAEAASITSYIHQIAESPANLCPATSTTPGGNNNTATITPYPTAAGNGTSPGTVGPSTSIPIAAAARPTGVIAGAAAIGGLIGAVALL